jgi:signal transduction histidine kinase
LRKSGIGQSHQELTRVLIGLKACIEVSIQRHQALTAELDPSLLDAAALADLAVTTVRRLSADQVAANLEEMGFWGAFDAALFDFTELAATPVEFLIDARVARIELPKESALLILRVASQALATAADYPPATRIAVRLFLNGPELVLTVADNGADSDPFQSLTTTKRRVAALRKLARAQRGEVSLCSWGGGTITRLSLHFRRALRCSVAAAARATAVQRFRLPKAAAYSS